MYHVVGILLIFAYRVFCKQCFLKLEVYETGYLFGSVSVNPQYKENVIKIKSFASSF